MRKERWPRIAAAVLWLLGSGCTSLREIPRTDFGAEPQRHNVHLRTRDGLVYEFDDLSLVGDTLIGTRQRDSAGSFDEIGSVQIALDDVEQLSARRIDWYRTGLIGGGALAAIIVAGLNKPNRNPTDEPTSGGGGGKPLEPGRP